MRAIADILACATAYTDRCRVAPCCSLAWCLPTGFQSIVPYFYAVRAGCLCSMPTGVPACALSACWLVLQACMLLP